MKIADESFDDVKFARLATRLGRHGLEILGSFRITGGGENEAMFGLMIVNAGKAMWSAFRQSEEWNDSRNNPLDRWSERVILECAKGLGAELRLPSQKPFLPFQQWAGDAGKLEQSPLGVLMHPEYGLWFGLRGAIVFPLNVSIQLVESLIQQGNDGGEFCKKCVKKPCLTHCPVNAFSIGQLDVDACFSHLDSGKFPKCMDKGCRARAACPVGTKHHYETEQLHFHMKSYRGLTVSN